MTAFGGDGGLVSSKSLKEMGAELAQISKEGKNRFYSAAAKGSIRLTGVWIFTK